MPLGLIATTVSETKIGSSILSSLIRRRGRVVYYSGLENRSSLAVSRGFKSHRLL